MQKVWKGAVTWSVMVRRKKKKVADTGAACRETSWLEKEQAGQIEKKTEQGQKLGHVKSWAVTLKTWRTSN